MRSPWCTMGGTRHNSGVSEGRTGRNPISGPPMGIAGGHAGSGAFLGAPAHQPELKPCYHCDCLTRGLMEQHGRISQWTGQPTGHKWPIVAANGSSGLRAGEGGGGVGQGGQH